MTTESKSLALIPSSHSEMQALADSFAKSALLPDALRGKAADVFVSIVAGAELGLPPMAAIRGVHVVQGRPILSADTMVAIVMGSGLAEYFMCVEETATSCTYETKRRGAPQPQRITWSDEDTKRAGLNTKEVHRLYTRAMRKARAKSMLARDAYPDVLAGCYDPDEIEQPVRQAYTPPTDATDAEIVDTSAVDGALSDIENAADVNALKSLAKSIKDLGLTGDAKKRVTDAYQARKAVLEAPPPVVTNGVNTEATQP